MTLVNDAALFDPNAAANVVERFLTAWKSNDVEALRGLLAPHFAFQDEAFGVTWSADEVVTYVEALHAACPDLVVTVAPAEAAVAGPARLVTFEGTLVEAIDLGPVGLDVVDAPGARFVLAPQTFHFTVTDGKIVTCIAAAVPGAGLSALTALA